MPRSRTLHESHDHNAMRSRRIALCPCEGYPIVTPICLRALSSHDELKNRLHRQLVIPIHQRDEYEKRSREAENKVRMFERKALLLRAQVNSLRHGSDPNNSVSKQLQELREQLRNWKTLQQWPDLSTDLQMPHPTCDSENKNGTTSPGDKSCSLCGQPLTDFSIRLRDAMRARQELKNSFDIQLAMIIQQRDEFKTRARKTETKVRVWERRHILMKAQLRAAREAFKRDMELGN